VTEAAMKHTFSGFHFFTMPGDMAAFGQLGYNTDDLTDQ
jgi:hypothetical protein